MSNQTQSEMVDKDGFHSLYSKSRQNNEHDEHAVLKNLLLVEDFHPRLLDLSTGTNEARSLLCRLWIYIACTQIVPNETT